MRRCFAALTLFLALAVAPVATASPITIGSPLTGSFISEESHAKQGLTVAQTTLPGAVTRSPVSGLLVDWRAVGLDVQGEYRVRVLRPGPDGRTTGVGTGPLEKMKAASGVNEYPVSLPIQAGDEIGLDVSYEGNIGERETPGATFSFWQPYLGDGQTLAPAPFEEPAEDVDPIEFGFDAIVRPAPSIASMTPGSGSFKGGNTIVIEGSDLVAVTSVTFAGTPATFTSASETKLEVVVPPTNKPGKSGVTVTGTAGMANVKTLYEYTACQVPNLRKKKLKAARKALTKSDCKLGKVKRKPGGTGKVKKQSPKSGKLLAPGSKVKVTLG